MKKTLSVILAVLLIFSTVGVMAFAAGEEDNLVTIKFFVDVADFDTDASYYKLEALPGESFFDRLENGIVAPEKASTETTKYIFKAWEQYMQDENGEWKSTGETYGLYMVPEAPALSELGSAKEIRYVAVFAEEEIKASQTFWAFVASIFARINQLFEYFAEVFRGVIEF